MFQKHSPNIRRSSSNLLPVSSIIFRTSSQVKLSLKNRRVINLKHTTSHLFKRSGYTKMTIADLAPQTFTFLVHVHSTILIVPVIRSSIILPPAIWIVFASTNPLATIESLLLQARFHRRIREEFSEAMGGAFHQTYHCHIRHSNSQSLTASQALLSDALLFIYPTGGPGSAVTC